MSPQFWGMMCVGEWEVVAEGSQASPLTPLLMQVHLERLALCPGGYAGSDKGSLPSEMCNEI